MTESEDARDLRARLNEQTLALAECLKLSRLQQRQIDELQIEILAFQMFYFHVVHPEMQEMRKQNPASLDRRLDAAVAEIDDGSASRSMYESQYRRQVIEKLRQFVTIARGGQASPFTVIPGGKT